MINTIKPIKTELSSLNKINLNKYHPDLMQGKIKKRIDKRYL